MGHIAADSTNLLSLFRRIDNMSSGATPAAEGSPYDINSPTDSVIGADFQGLSAEEQERQREEWKAELKKTEEEILTLKQVLTAKERHAAVLKRRLGITQWREFSEDMTQGLKNLQESATYKRTAENLQFAKDIAREKSGANRRHIGFLHLPESEWKCVFCLRSCQEPDVRLRQSTDVRRGPEGAQRQCGRQQRGQDSSVA